MAFIEALAAFIGSLVSILKYFTKTPEEAVDDKNAAFDKAIKDSDDSGRP